MRVRVFEATYNHAELTKEINEFLRDDGIELVDVKYQDTFVEIYQRHFYSALVIYRYK